MIVVIDACSTLYLLQTVLEEKYIDYLERLFEQIHLPPKVFEEIKANKDANLSSWTDKERLDNIIHRKLRKFINNDNIDECCNLLKHKSGYQKRNGEFFSTALSLYLSRMGGDEFNDKVLEVCLITDDGGAEEDFLNFFKLNQIGQIIDSIDAVTLFYLKSYITKKELLDYCIALKGLFGHEMNTLIAEIKQLQARENKAIFQQVLTRMLEAIYNSNFEKLGQIKQDKNFKKLKRQEKKLNTLFEDLLKLGVKEKILQIEQRRQDLEYVWKIE